jgi:hypothetical protein
MRRRNHFIVAATALLGAPSRPAPATHVFVVVYGRDDCTIPPIPERKKSYVKRMTVLNRQHSQCSMPRFYKRLAFRREMCTRKNRV